MTGRVRPGVRLAAVGFVVAAGVSCGGGEGSGALNLVARLRFGQDAGPVALAVASDGRILVGERLTGAVRVVEPHRRGWRLVDQPLAVVDVNGSTTGQRGLLGVAVIADWVFAAWTRPGDRRIVVAQVSPERRTVWEPTGSPLHPCEQW